MWAPPETRRPLSGIVKSDVRTNVEPDGLHRGSRLPGDVLHAVLHVDGRRGVAVVHQHVHEPPDVTAAIRVAVALREPELHVLLARAEEALGRQRRRSPVVVVEATAGVV